MVEMLSVLLQTTLRNSRFSSLPFLCTPLRSSSSRLCCRSRVSLPSPSSPSLLSLSLEDVLVQVKKYYQPRKSRRIISITFEGDKVSLYGAGSSLTVTDAGVSSSNGQQLVPFTLDLEIHSKGYVVGKLVRTKHQLHASCAIEVDYAHYMTKLIKFKQDCSYS